MMYVIYIISVVFTLVITHGLIYIYILRLHIYGIDVIYMVHIILDVYMIYMINVIYTFELCHIKYIFI